MKIPFISNKINTNQKCGNPHAKFAVQTNLPQYNILSNAYYQPNLHNTFTGTWFEDNVIKKVHNKEYQGQGLYNGNYIDFAKVGTDFLSKEPVDLTKATDNEVYAYWHANALREAYECTWVRRFNKYNMVKPLALFHNLEAQDVSKLYSENLDILLNKSRGLSLDIPITNKKGELSLDCVVFDTETTGVNINKGSPQDWDKIIQIGAIQVKNGKINQKSAYSQLINPERHIPEGATQVHGITDEMVKDKPTMEKVLTKFLDNYMNKENGIIVAYNSKFDMTLLNNAIREHNVYSHKDLKQKQMYKVLDPFLIMQRIHPYLGARKRLSEQYQFLFCKNMDNAHDAFSDVKGTVDLLKYTLYYLSENRKNKSIPLTLREVLIFQNGGKVENIDIPYDSERANANVNYKKSYIYTPVNVDNYFKGYKLTKKALKEIAPIIGEDNVKRLTAEAIVNQEITLDDNGYKHPNNPAETKRIPNERGFVNAFYVLRKNAKMVIGFAKLEPYGDKTKEEIEELVLEKSKLYINQDNIQMWIKNTNPKDIKDGNDLPNLTIARKVMKENKDDDDF